MKKKNTLAIKARSQAQRESIRNKQFHLKTAKVIICESAKGREYFFLGH